MKISELISKLALQQEEFGDLECCVYVGSGIEPIERTKVHLLQDFDFGKIEGKRTGERVLLVWAL